MTDGAVQARRTRRERVARRLRGRFVPGVGYPKDKGMRRRAARTLEAWRHWWDWGHPLMVLTGRDDGGDYSPPEPRAWYYTEAEWEKRGHRHQPRLIVAKSYDEWKRIDGQMQAARAEYASWYRSLPNDEQMAIVRNVGRSKQCPPEPYWHYMNVQDDGAVLIPGNIWGEQGGRNYGLDRRVSRLLVRYVVVEWWLKANWLGIRPWLYYKGLHRAVDCRIPFRCQERPPKDSGGYDHWACQKPKRHDGEHRVNNYTWRDAQVTYDPVEARRG